MFKMQDFRVLRSCFIRSPCALLIASRLVQSATCQKEAWKSGHKTLCAQIDFPKYAPEGSSQLIIAAMHAFAEMHMSTIINVAIDSLDLYTYPDRGRQLAFYIRLELRPEPTVVEKMFEAVDAKPVAIDQYFIGHRDSIQEYIARLEASIARARLERNSTSAEGFNVILFNSDYGLHHALPVCFDPTDQDHQRTDFGPEYPDLSGIEGLLAFLNGGIARRRAGLVF
jgi:hypothetical protein